MRGISSILKPAFDGEWNTSPIGWQSDFTWKFQKGENTLDYRSMVNPTYMTAQSTLLMLAASGNADAQEFIREMGIQDGIQRNQNQSKPSPISEADRKALMVGASLAAKA